MESQPGVSVETRSADLLRGRIGHHLRVCVACSIDLRIEGLGTRELQVQRVMGLRLWCRWWRAWRVQLPVNISHIGAVGAPQVALSDAWAASSRAKFATPRWAPTKRAAAGPAGKRSFWWPHGVAVGLLAQVSDLGAVGAAQPAPLG